MSSQKGNTKRTRPQKHQNSRAFKNDLHDKTPKTKFLNSLEISDVCLHCKRILEWRIKFKKYKLLKNPKTCVKCDKKTIVLSYRIMCAACADKLKVCPKCGKNESEVSEIPSTEGIECENQGRGSDEDDSSDTT